MKHTSLFAVVAILGSTFFAACDCSDSGESDGESTASSLQGATVGSSGTDAGSGGQDGVTVSGISVSMGSGSADGGGEPGALAIEPADATLDLDGTPATQDFIARDQGGDEPSNVVWTNSPDLAGYIDQGGVFHASGFTAGVTTIHAEVGSLEAATSFTLNVEVFENPGLVSEDDQDLLLAGGSADPDFRWLYPYDRTIFPRGLSGPELQLAGGDADATYVKIAFSNYTYEAFFGASSPTRLTIPQDVWDGITLSAGATDDVEVSVTKLAGGQVTGPVTERWRIAQGSLKGVIYYNTYSSGGAIKRIRPGQQSETLQDGCPVCHSVASRGTVLASGLSWGDGGNPNESGTFDLNADGSMTTRVADPEGRKFPFAGLTPDGTYALGSGVPTDGNYPRGLTGTFPSKLYDTATGVELAVPTLDELVTYAMTPNFSHDGEHVAFTNQDSGSAKSLQWMSVDDAQSPPSFSDIEELTQADGNVAAWPSFLPDSSAVLFHDGERYDTQAGCNGPSYADVRMVDTETKDVVQLDRLNGYDEDGNFTLPYGEVEEAHVNYEPTLLPVPVGGYYWVIFTSRRAYGNYLGPEGSDGGLSKWGTCNPETPSPRKKLWVAAIDTNWQGEIDPSHPPFYLPGQELATGNMRAFAALEPCRDEDAECEFAFECCDGRQCLPNGEVDEAGKPIKTCQEPPEGECSPEGGACGTSADCCDPEQTCINGFCAVGSPPPPPN